MDRRLELEMERAREEAEGSGSALESPGAKATSSAFDASLGEDELNAMGWGDSTKPAEAAQAASDRPTSRAGAGSRGGARGDEIKVTFVEEGKLGITFATVHGPDAPGESRPAAAIPVDNTCSSCKLTRVRTPGPMKITKISPTGESVEPGGCAAFGSHPNTSMLTHPARGQGWGPSTRSSSRTWWWLRCSTGRSTAKGSGTRSRRVAADCCNPYRESVPQL